MKKNKKTQRNALQIINIVMNSLFESHRYNKKSDLQGSVIESVVEYSSHIQLSKEQWDYVTYDFLSQNEDTTLIACAGSGKTRCMIEKIRYLVLKQLVQRDQILVFSYSKLTIEHTKNCCKQFQDKNYFYNDKLIKTIDAFCYSLMSKNMDNCVVQILSAKFHELLENKDKTIYKKLSKGKLANIKAIFIDEAQDLNEIQYKIILHLKKILGCTLHFIGDPNQNIYQFRKSYEKYFLQHQSRQFYLSKNFRSIDSIEAFSQYFKFYIFNSDKSIIENKTDNILIQTNTSCYNDLFIVQEIRKLLKQGFKHNQIAIISPIIGEQFGVGLVRIANLLDKEMIPYINYYNETKDNTQKKIKGKAKKKGIHLLTIHGSKGLEFRAIFLVKFQDRMLFNESFDGQYIASQNMNLLYVAITRAKERLYIIHDVTSNSNSKHICSLLVTVPQVLYSVSNLISQQNLDKDILTINQKIHNRKKIVDDDPDFVPIGSINERNDVLLAVKPLVPNYFEMNCNELRFTNACFKMRTSVTQFIQSLQQIDILKLTNVINYKKKCKQLYSISDDQAKLYQDVRQDQEALVGYLFEYLFFYQIQQFKNKHPIIPKIIFTIKDIVPTQKGLLKINQQCIISSASQQIQLNQINESLQKTLKEGVPFYIQSDSQQSITDEEYASINASLQDRMAEFLDFGTIGIDQFNIILKNSQFINESIQKFNKKLIWQHILDSIIYIVMLKYATISKHQKYFNYDIQKIQHLQKFEPLFAEMEQLAKSMAQQNILYQFEVNSHDIIGYIDFLFIDPQQHIVMDMKIQNELGIENVIQLLLYDLLLEESNIPQSQQETRLIILNCLKGVSYEILIEDKQKVLSYISDLLQEDQYKRIC